MSADTMSAVFDLMEPQGIISEEVLFELDQLFGERLISEFAAFNVRTLATEISVRRGVLIPTQITSIDLASELLTILRKLEYIGESEAPAADTPEVKEPPEQSDRWYRQQLEAAANRSIDQMSRGITVGKGIYLSLTTMSGSISLDDTIVLDTIETMSGSIKGNAFVARSTDVSSMSGRVTPNIKVLSLPDLYKKAVKLGLIEV